MPNHTMAKTIQEIGGADSIMVSQGEKIFRIILTRCIAIPRINPTPKEISRPMKTLTMVSRARCKKIPVKILSSKELNTLFTSGKRYCEL